MAAEDKICVYCDQPVADIVELSLVQPDGCLSAWACRNCAGAMLESTGLFDVSLVTVKEPVDAKTQGGGGGSGLRVA